MLPLTMMRSGGVTRAVITFTATGFGFPLSTKTCSVVGWPIDFPEMDRL